MEANAQSSGEGGLAQSAAAPSDFLGQLTEDDVRDLFNIGVAQHFRKGNLVFRASDPGDKVYFLQTGRIKICQTSPVGKEVILWFCFRGEIFGLAEVARGGGRVVKARACDASEVLVVPQEAFKAYLSTHPRAALISLQVLASRLRILGEVLVNLVSDDTSIRIAKLILRLSARYGVRTGQEIVLKIPLTHQEIADMTGTTRQTVTSVISQLKKRGVLSIDNRQIHIENEMSLSALLKM